MTTEGQRDGTWLALKMRKEAVSPAHGASKSWKRRENGFSPKISEVTQPCQMCDFSPMRLSVSTPTDCKRICAVISTSCGH